MPPQEIKIEIPSDAKDEDIKNLVAAKLTSTATSLLRKDGAIALSIFLAQPAVTKKAGES